MNRRYTQGIYLVKRNHKFILFIGLVLAGAMGALTFFLSPDDGRNEAVVQPSSEMGGSGNELQDIVFPVEVAVARRGDLVKHLQTNGVVRANREAEIVARVNGEIVSVFARNGKFVKQGEVLVKLDDREHQLAYEKASTGLLAAQIEYKTLSSSPFLVDVDSLKLQDLAEEASRKFHAVERQYSNGLMALDEYVRAKREYETDIAYFNAHRSDVIANKSGLSQAKEMYERAKMNLEWTEQRAPFSGYIADCDLSPGMHISSGKTLCRLVDVSKLLVDVEILENEISSIAVGRRAEVSVNAYPTGRFVGKIAAINPVVDPKSKTVRVTLELKNGGTPPENDGILHKDTGEKKETDSRLTVYGSFFLRPGMYATAHLETAVLHDRLMVPREAVLVRDQRTLVFVAQDGLAKWHYVEVGEQNEEYLEIKSGIVAADIVIVSGHYTLAHDAKVSFSIAR